MATYLTDLTPGRGRRSPARAWLDSDAPQLVLDGTWQFQWSPVAVGLSEAAAAPDFDDSDWDAIEVPGHWVLDPRARYGQPIYTNVQFPFPIDPPHVPDQNPTGDYRRHFTLPDWPVEKFLLRFDGVESVYRVWLNGIEVGVGKGSRLVQEFDVTEQVEVGENVIMVRVHQWSSMSYVEDQDQWWLPGIFRSVTLLGRPAGSIEDVWLRTAYTDGQGRIDPELVAAGAAFPVQVEIAELGVERTFETAAELAAFEVGAVEPWDAENPRLYDVVVRSTGETLRLRLGFRTVQVVGDQLLVNGTKLVFRGMNRHETHPLRGRAFDHDHARADLIMMKQAGVNAIRTSHYPPHPRVLDLADELGLWVIDECDLETHGFHAVGWSGNPSDDPDWESVYLDRVERTVERDKNHASVIIWSLGNEAGTGRNLALMAQWVRRRDHERPVHYEGDYTGAYTDLYSRMYPNFDETAAIGSDRGHISYLTAPAEAVRVRSKPFLLCEYGHAMGNGPGGLSEYDALIDRLPRFHGGFIWEWRDHGLLSRTADGVDFYAYGGDFGEVVHDGNFVMDGMILPDDTPMPSLGEFTAVNAPMIFTRHGDQVRVRNRYHRLGSDHLRFVATLEHDGHPASEVELSVPLVAAGESVTIALPVQVLDVADSAESWLTVRAELAAEAPWAPAGHVIAWQQFALTPDRTFPEQPVDTTPELVEGPSSSALRQAQRTSFTTPEPASSAIPELVEGPSSSALRQAQRTSFTTPEPASSATPELVEGPSSSALREAQRTSSAEFDLSTGRLTELFGLAVDGPRLELWRAPTDNDRSGQRGSYELGDPADTDGEGVPGPSSEQRWRERGLDRLVHRVVSVDQDHDQLVTRVRSAAADSGLYVDVTYRWRRLDADQDSGIELRVEVVPSTGWDCTWPRVGVRLDLPAGLDRAAWFGTGPNESYPDTRRNARVGRFAATVEELNVAYSRPQETGHRAALRTLTVSDGTGPRLQVETVPDRHGHRPGFTLTPHTPQELDHARHPHELAPSAYTYLFLDSAVHGVGSRACGVDVLPAHALWPGTQEFTVRFTRPVSGQPAL